MTTNPLFRSDSGRYAVYPCACGCDGAVKINNEHEIQIPESDRRFYIASHAPLGAVWWRKGSRFEWEAEDTWPDETTNPMWQSAKNEDFDF